MSVTAENLAIEALAQMATVVTPGIALVNTVGKRTFQPVALRTCVASTHTDCDIIVVRDTEGEMAARYHKRYVVAPSDLWINEVSLRQLLPEGFECSLDAGVRITSEDRLEASPEAWRTLIFPALRCGLHHHARAA
ncbi:MAG: hypothetical protein Q7S66_04380 [bacterium]|nr:hypothetical protein [bacterium]